MVRNEWAGRLAGVRWRFFLSLFACLQFVDSLFEDTWCCADNLPDVPCAYLWRRRHPSVFFEVGD